MRSAPGEGVPTDAASTGTAVLELKQLKAAFDAACRELGAGLTGLDIAKREILIKRAMRIAHTYACAQKR